MLSAADLLSHVDRITDPVALVDRILRAGLLMRASDVHFDPFESFVRVRFRIDGELEEVLRIPSSMQGALTGRLKVLSAMDIAEKRAPQDGGFTWRMTFEARPPHRLQVHSIFVWRLFPFATESVSHCAFSKLAERGFRLMI